MHRIYTIFSELLKLVPRYHFDKAVEVRGTERYVKSFSTWSHFIAMLYSQITGKDSLRDIETGLQAQSARWYHLGFCGVHRSTLADANAKRDYKVFEDTFYKLLDRCRDLTPKHRFRFKNPLYTIDATTIDLCLSMFPWAKFRTTKGAIKMHCLYDHSGALPTFLTVTDGKKHEVRVIHPFLKDIREKMQNPGMLANVEQLIKKSKTGPGRLKVVEQRLAARRKQMKEAAART